jgi:myo-inositol-1(or 4)-monophosphatase
VQAFLRELAEGAGEILMRYHGALASADVEQKGPRDLVSVADREAEAHLVEAIRAAHPEDGILGEEGSSIEGTSGRRWILDPLDGTTNFVHGLPFFCVSIGLEVDGEIAHGCVYAPVMGEMFLASRGEGATLNGAPLTVSDQSELGRALVATGFADARTRDVLRLDRFERILNRVASVRRLGSAALDLCYVARGWFDGFFEWNLNPWDVAGGALIVREAGGVVTDGLGGDDWLCGRSLVAAGPGLQGKLREVLAMPLADAELGGLQARMAEFVAARDWQAWHVPKNLAMALGVEAAELAEIFQWRSAEESSPAGLGPDLRLRAGEELADIFAYVLSMANALDLDLASTFSDKMAANAERYPPGGAWPDAWGAGQEEE